MPGSKASAAKGKQTLIDTKFNGDVEAYLEYMRMKGAKGGAKSKRGKAKKDN